jgi:hypothetical protein
MKHKQRFESRKAPNNSSGVELYCPACDEDSARILKTKLHQLIDTLDTYDAAAMLSLLTEE